MAKKQRKAAAKATTARAAQPARKSQPKTAPKAPAGGGGGRAAIAAVPATPPPGALEQELLQLARGAASTLQKVLLTIVVLAALAGIGAGLWALRPIPTFSSEDIVAGSPFDVLMVHRNPGKRQIAWLRRAGIPFIYDIDDLLLSADGDLSGRRAQEQDAIRWCLGNALLIGALLLGEIFVGATIEPGGRQRHELPVALLDRAEEAAGAVDDVLRVRTVLEVLGERVARKAAAVCVASVRAPDGPVLGKAFGFRFPGHANLPRS